MKIYEDKCIGCENCIPYCAMNAISMVDGIAVIDQEECVECGVCLRVERCPVDAIYENEESNQWPRSVRKVFSDATAKHENTGVRGRGTEEVKTNDVTARFKRGFIGVALEFGRPGVGTKLKDVEVITEALAKEGVEFEPKNPLTFLFTDASTGKIREDVREEKVLSAIVEFVIPEEKIEKIFSLIQEAADKTETVFSWGLVARFDDEGNLPIVDKLEKMGFRVPRNMKINVGLGRPLREE
ncbi:MAG: (4Fe-4S)-binding protein [Clostridiales bacterium]|nr:(4Fe-4S)-binding protein [Clostridiales bacterium]